MAERSVGTNTRKKLINNEPFAYAHLVKFERPSSTLTNGNYSTDAKRYAYFTDAATNLNFDDQSYNTAGGSNGSQIYVANKLTQVGTYSETVEAKASGMTLTLAAESLNNTITSTGITMTSTTITVPAGIDLVREGFREGDKVFISGGTNSGKYVNVTGIKTNNTVLVVSNIDSTQVTQSTGTSITLSIVSDELQGPLGETNLSTVKSYANRDVWVYKAFLDPDTGVILDSTPILIFKGIITKASIVENPGASVQAKWTLTSHWGDFAQVRGRPTNDAVHRALDNNSRGQPLVSVRPEYANDLGFLHAEETLNILATYTTIEQETKYKMKKKWYGKVKMKEVITDVEVENDVDLSFSLASKFLPVVYGVQRISGIPFFVDTKENDPNNIFLAYALCEGEIGGIYDLYMEGNPLMCINKEDADDRDASSGSQLEQIEVHCRGRADLGNTLGGVKLSGTGVSGSNDADYDYGNSYIGYAEMGYEYENDYIEAQIAKYYQTNNALKNTTVSTTDGTGVQHGETISLTAPNNMSLTFHAGKIDQKADNTLIGISQASSGSRFKRQADYYTGEEDYWGPNHRVLDTAYVVMDVEIGEDATTVPEVEYVVRGKLCSSFNYDYSYAHSPTPKNEGGTESQANFNVGDKVVLHNKSGDGVINSSVLIIDKWNFTDPDGNVQYRFRFSTAPSLGYSDGYATIKEFYMLNSAGNKSWTMATWDYTDSGHGSGTVPSANTQTVTINNNGASPATMTVPANWEIINELYGDPEFADYYAIAINNTAIPYGNVALWWNKTNSTTLTQAGTGGSSQGLVAGSQEVISKDTIKLASGASTSDDIYNDFDIKLTKTTTGEDGSSQTQSWTRTITDYDGGTKIATINTPWDNTFEPAANDTYTLKAKIKNGRTDDKRVSINPAIQLLDYLTARYGKGLKLDTDISLADFLLAARTCDDRGTQTMQGAQAGSVGDRFVLTSDGTTSGDVIAMGLVKTKGTSNSVDFTEFQQVYGKFTKKFMKNSYSYLVGDMIYTSAGYYRVTSAGTKATAPTGTNPTGFTGPLTSVPLFAINSSTGVVSGSAVTFTRVKNSKYYNPCAVYNTATTGYDTGYSLYDSDHVKYWRYYGWDDKHQRFATRHQTQGTVSTADSVFENVNGFLKNFNGLLSYEGGKYALRIEVASDTIASTVVTAANSGSYSGYTKGVQYNPRVIDDDDIIGNITINDRGTQKSYNTVSTSIQDPANLFKGRAVTFYDSNYLRADKNVVKSGQINIASVSNYYNARINVENYLRKSRFGLSISFKTGPKSLLLLAGDTITISNSKFGFVEKYFRITNINYAKDCTATVTAEEYDDSFYSISTPTLPSVASQDQRQGLQATPSAPSSLSASVAENVLGGINLAWTNGSGLTTANCFTEIWSSPNSTEGNRTLLTRVPFPSTTFVDQLGKKGVARYYWVRSGKVVTLTSGGQNKTKELFSAFVGPANAVTIAPISAFGVRLEGEQIFTDTSGTLAPTSIALTTTRTNSTGNVTYAAVNNSSASVTLTNGTNTGVTLTSTNFGSATSVVITATLTTTSDEQAQGAASTYTFAHTIRKLLGGVQGQDGATGPAGVRGGSEFSFEESSTSGLSAANVTSWVGTLDDANANAIASVVMAAAADNTIRPNDRITVTDNSAQKAGTRIYTAAATTTATDADAADFSSLVVQHFDGSVIVDGTLSADKITSNTNFTNNLSVSSALTLGATGGTGVLKTPGKDSFTDNTNGFYLDTSGNFFLGDATNHLKYQASNGAVTLAGTLNIQGPQGAQGAQGAQGQAGTAAQNQKTVELFKKDDSTFGTTTSGTFANPTSGAESGWTTSVPTLSAAGEKAYMVRRVFTSDGNSPQDSAWSSPVVVSAFGAQGGQGNQGNQGNQGAQGNQGNQGAQGNQGNQGAQGAPGNNGNNGSNAVQPSFFIITGVGTNAPSDSQFSAVAGRTPLNHDVVLMKDSGTNSYRRESGSWTAVTAFIDGDMVVSGSINGDRINAASTITVGGNNILIQGGSNRILISD